MKPLVSVIMPAYNSADAITMAIDSVGRQGLREWELLIVDDCSSDGTWEAARLSAKKDSRIRVMRNTENLGAARTRNIGCRQASGEFWAFLDSDDIWEPDKLEKQVERLGKARGDLCYTSYSFIGENGRATRKPYLVPENVSYDGLLKESVIGCSTVLLRASVMEGHSFNPAFFHEDYALWLELLRDGYMAVGIPEVLCRYRMGGRSANKLRAARNRWKVYRESERLTLMPSIRYMAHYALHGLRKYAAPKKP